MSIQIPPGFSVSLPVTITFGPPSAITTDVTTALTNISSTDTSKVKAVYPDPTPGIANPLRSIRIDMDAATADGAGANVTARYTSPYDGTVRNIGPLFFSAFKAPDAGAASFGTPGSPFLTPAP